jgi:5-methylcytosine-specific restriction endonuclease McrA
MSIRSSQQQRVRMRAYLLERDGRTCMRCGDPIDPRETPSLGHIRARARGGSDEPGNLRLEHLVCNQRAGVNSDARPRARAVFYSAEIAATEPTVASIGRRSGRMPASRVRYAEIAPRAPRIDGDGS